MPAPPRDKPSLQQPDTRTSSSSELRPLSHDLGQGRLRSGLHTPPTRAQSGPQRASTVMSEEGVPKTEEIVIVAKLQSAHTASSEAMEPATIKAWTVASKPENSVHGDSAQGKASTSALPASRVEDGGVATGLYAGFSAALVPALLEPVSSPVRQRSRLGAEQESMPPMSPVSMAKRMQKQGTPFWQQMWKVLIDPIMPNSVWYKRWWYATVASAVWVAIYGYSPYYDFSAFQNYVNTAIYVVDMYLNCKRAFLDGTGVVVTDFWATLKNYARSMLVADLIFLLPWDDIVLTSMGLEGQTTRTTLTISALGFLRLGEFLNQAFVLRLINPYHIIMQGRTYRLLGFFQDLEHRMVLSQLALMLLRNNMVLFLSAHWFGCGFYLLARIECEDNFEGSSTWVGRAWLRFESEPWWQRYIISLYFAVSAFTGLGDGDLFEASPAEAFALILYLAYNIIMMAYILGTVTLLMVKGDKKSKQHTDHVTSLKVFSGDNDLPENLERAMYSHLKMTHNSNLTPDEEVLALYPRALRRKVVRHLYSALLRDVNLFNGCSAQFLDAVLAAAQVDVYMPQAMVLTEGDIVTELSIITHGRVGIIKPGGGNGGKNNSMAFLGGSVNAGNQNNGSSQGARDTSARYSAKDDNSNSGSKRVQSLSGSVHGSMFGGSMRSNTSSGNMKLKADLVLGTSDTFGEVPFFSDEPCEITIVAMTMVKVLMINKQAYRALSDTYPEQMGVVLANMQAKADADMKFELANALETAQLSPHQMDMISQYTLGDASLNDMPPDVWSSIKEYLTPQQLTQMETLDLVKGLVRSYKHKVDTLRIYKFLNCAAKGNLEAMKDMAEKDLPIDSADYDNRTALMLACHEGHTQVVEYLLKKNCDPMLRDNFGNTAMFEAVRSEQDRCVALLQEHNASLGMDGCLLAAQMCSAVYDKELTKLKRFLKSGADPDAADYDNRCPLHIAAAEGFLPAVRLMIETGSAKVDFQDRWNHTALDEARRVNASDVIGYLTPLMSLAAQGRIHCCAHPDAPTFKTLVATHPDVLLAVGVEAKYLQPLDITVRTTKGKLADGINQKNRGLRFALDDGGGEVPQPGIMTALDLPAQAIKTFNSHSVDDNLKAEGSGGVLKSALHKSSDGGLHSLDSSAHLADTSLAGRRDHTSMNRVFPGTAEAAMVGKMLDSVSFKPSPPPSGELKDMDLQRLAPPSPAASRLHRSTSSLRNAITPSAPDVTAAARSQRTALQLSPRLALMQEIEAVEAMKKEIHDGGAASVGGASPRIATLKDLGNLATHPELQHLQPDAAKEGEKDSAACKQRTDLLSWLDEAAKEVAQVSMLRPADNTDYLDSPLAKAVLSEHQPGP